MSTARETLSVSRHKAHKHRASDVPVTDARKDPEAERRNAASRAAVLRRVSREFHEMPGMRLTAAQAKRLFGLRQDICIRVLATLVEEAVLRCDPNGAYCLDGDHP